MKKSVLFVFAMIIAVGAFAQEEKGAGEMKKRHTFEIGAGFHSVTETYDVSGGKLKRTFPAFAVNLAGSTFFKERVGFAVYANLIFPQKVIVSAASGALEVSGTVDKSAYSMLFSFDALVGPAFILYKNEKFYLPLAVGLHYIDMGNKLGGVTTKTIEVGIGANITGEYHFNQKVYVYGRFQASADFYKYKGVSGGGAGASKGFSLSSIGIAPVIGVGFRW